MSTSAPHGSTEFTADDVGTITVALSGGVDSAVSALSLLQAGYTVEAVFMKNWEEDDTNEYCAAAEDLQDAERVCEQLGVPLRTVNFATEYWERVFGRFLEEYQAGRTPNPDVWCNREIKFRELYDFLSDIGRKCVATGHYARVQKSDDGFQLLRGLDQSKDQSYFLYMLGQPELARINFPVGTLLKHQVRSAARTAGLRNYDKKGSTGICFIGERPFRAFLSQYIAPSPGPVRTPNGRIVGEHQGLHLYTLGQRQGLGIGGTKNGDGQPWYVVDKMVEEQTLIVAQGRHHPLLYSKILEAIEPTWIAGVPPQAVFRACAQSRYRQTPQACTVTVTSTGFQTEFDEPQWAVTPGQSVVLYDADVCLGGGLIAARWTP